MVRLASHLTWPRLRRSPDQEDLLPSMCPNIPCCRSSLSGFRSRIDHRKRYRRDPLITPSPFPCKPEFLRLEPRHPLSLAQLCFGFLYLDVCPIQQPFPPALKSFVGRRPSGAQIPLQGAHVLFATAPLLSRALRLRVLPTDRLRQTARRCSRPLARTPGARLYLPFVGRAAARGPALFDLQLLVHSVHFAGKAG